MLNLAASPRSEALPTVGVGASQLLASDRRPSRGLLGVHRNMVLRVASVQAHAVVQTEKIHEVFRLAGEAATGQAVLEQRAAALAHGDPFVADHLRYFSDLARAGAAELIADTVRDFCQEGRL